MMFAQSTPHLERALASNAQRLHTKLTKSKIYIFYNHHGIVYRAIYNLRFLLLILT